MNEALQMQLEVQRRLHEQLEVEDTWNFCIYTSDWNFFPENESTINSYLHVQNYVNNTMMNKIFFFFFFKWQLNSSLLPKHYYRGKEKKKGRRRKKRHIIQQTNWIMHASSFPCTTVIFAFSTNKVNVFWNKHTGKEPGTILWTLNFELCGQEMSKTHNWLLEVHVHKYLITFLRTTDGYKIFKNTTFYMINVLEICAYMVRI